MKGRSARWDAWAAQICAQFPLAATDWDQHSEAVESGFYSVQKRTETPLPAKVQSCEIADEPLSLEEQEMLF